MQALHRLTSDMPVQRGDLLRLQVAHLSSSFVFGQLSRGLLHSRARLLKLVAEDCAHDVLVYAYASDDFKHKSEAFLSPRDSQSEYLLGRIAAATQPPARRRGGSRRSPREAVAVFQAQVHQTFKFSIQLESGRRMGMLYQLPDSAAERWPASSEADRAGLQLPLDEFRITCPK